MNKPTWSLAMAIEYIAGGDPNALRKSATYMLLVAEAAEDVERQRQLQAARKRLWGWLENGDFTATAVDCHDGTIVSIRTEEWPRLELGTNHADDDVLRFRQEAAAKATQEWVDQYKHIRFWRSDVESLNVVGGTAKPKSESKRSGGRRPGPAQEFELEIRDKCSRIRNALTRIKTENKGASRKDLIRQLCADPTTKNTYAGETIRKIAGGRYKPWIYLGLKLDLD